MDILTLTTVNLKYNRVNYNSGGGKPNKKSSRQSIDPTFSIFVPLTQNWITRAFEILAPKAFPTNNNEIINSSGRVEEIIENLLNWLLS